MDSPSSTHLLQHKNLQFSGRGWLSLLLAALLVMLSGCRPAAAPAATATAVTLAPPDISTPLPPSSTPTPTISSQLLAELGRGAAESMRWSPDGRLLAIASATGVYLFDAETLSEQQHIGAGLWVTALDFSRDGLLLALGQRDGGVRVWDLQSKTFSRSLEGDAAAVTSLSFSPEGSQLAIGRVDSTLGIWRLADGQVRSRLHGHTDRLTAVDYGVQTLDGTPGGYMLASASRDGTVLAWNSGSGRSLTGLDLHEGAVNDLVFAPLPPGVDASSEKLASAGADGTIRFWAPQKNLLLLTMYAFAPPGEILPNGTGIESLAFTSDGGILAAGDEVGNIALWNGITGEPFRAFQALPGFPVRELAFRPGTTFLTTLGDDGVVRVWNGNPAANVEQVEQLPLQIFDGFSAAINDLALTGDASQLVTAHDDGALRLWELNNGLLQATLRGHNGPVLAMDIQPQGSQLVSGGRDGSLRIWDIEQTANPQTGSEAQDAQTRVLLGHKNMILDLAYTPDGTRIASSSADGSLRYWDAANGRPLDTLLSGQDWIYSLAFKPDGALLAVGDARGLLRYWDTSSSFNPLEAGEPVSAHSAELLILVYTPDGDWLISGDGQGTIKMWQDPSSSAARQLDGHTRRITALAVSPTGNLLASTSADGLLRIWSLPAGELLYEQAFAEPLTGVVFGASFQPGSYSIILGSISGIVQVWQVRGLP